MADKIYLSNIYEKYQQAIFTPAKVLKQSHRFLMEQIKIFTAIIPFNSKATSISFKPSIILWLDSGQSEFWW